MASDDLGLAHPSAQAAETVIDRVARALHISCCRQDIDGYLGAKIDCTVLAEVALTALGMRGNDALGIAREALERIATDQPYRSGYCQTDIEYEPALSAEEAFHVAGSALARIAALSAEGSATIAAAQKQAAEEMRERAANTAELIGQSYESAWRQDRKADPYLQGCADTADEAATAIRALPPSSSPEDQQKAAATTTIADLTEEGARHGS